MAQSCGRMEGKAKPKAGKENPGGVPWRCSRGHGELLGCGGTNRIKRVEMSLLACPRPEPGT